MQSGFDIDLGNACSSDAFGWAKTTFVNRHGKAGAAALRVDGAFANMLLFGDQRIGITSDGIGTKIELAERTQLYHTLGYDLVAMTADDLATAGFMPTNLSNIIDVDVLHQPTINALMQGLAAACNVAGMSISGGEIAELGNRIGGYGTGMHFNWCSTAIGVLPPQLEQPIDGTAVAAGNVVIALRSRGFRSNGFSAVRRTMQAAFGNEWHSHAYNDTQTWGEVLLTPSLIYAPLINQLIAQHLIPTGIAHITGGGIIDNFARVLKANRLGAMLDALHAPLEMMDRVQELGDISPEQAYLYWNMGNGMLLTCSHDMVDGILATAQQQGYTAQVAGLVVSNPYICIKTDRVFVQKNMY